MRALWFTLGIGALLLGTLGAFLPVLPTTPLVILAAFCFSKSSPRLHAWLLNTRLFGPLISDWETYGVIPLRVKWLACSMMIAILVISIFAGLPVGVILVQAIGISIGMLYVLTRPSRPVVPAPTHADAPRSHQQD